MFNRLEKFTDLYLFFFIILMLVLFEGKDSPFYIGTALMLGVIFLINVVKHRKILVSGHTKWLLVFTAFSAISTVWAINKTNAISLLPILVANELIAYIITYFVCLKPKRLHLVTDAIILGSIFLGLRIFLTYGIFIFSSARGAGGLNANYLGMYAATAANLALYHWHHGQKNQHWYLFLSGVCAIIALLSFSRKALIFLALPVLVQFILKHKNPWKILGGLLASVAIVAAGLFAVFNIDALYHSIGTRIEPIINSFMGESFEDSSVSARNSFIKYGQGFFMARPVVGAGLNNFKNLIASAKPFGMTDVYAHNNYIELGVDLGIIGLIIYYSLYFTIIIHGLKDYKTLESTQLLWLSLLITLMVCEYGIVSYYGNFYHLIITLSWYSLFPVSASKRT